LYVTFVQVMVVVVDVAAKRARTVVALRKVRTHDVFLGEQRPPDQAAKTAPPTTCSVKVTRVPAASLVVELRVGA
jgi:hypothetical protein